MIYNREVIRDSQMTDTSNFSCGKQRFLSAAKAQGAMVSTLTRAKRFSEPKRQANSGPHNPKVLGALKPHSYFCHRCEAWHWGNSISVKAKT